MQHADIKFRYVIVKKYIPQYSVEEKDRIPMGIKVDMYKYWKKKGMLVENIYDAKLFDSQYDAENTLKFLEDEGIFQIEKIYIKTL